jgi:hypothetical protein
MKTLEFNDYTKIIVTKKGDFFYFYEDIINPKSQCALKAFVTKRRLEYFNNRNVEYFKKLFNGENCFKSVNGIMFI